MYSDPIRLVEERMLLNVVNTRLHVAKPLGYVDLQQVLDQVTNIGTERRRKPHLSSVSTSIITEVK